MLLETDGLCRMDMGHKETRHNQSQHTNDQRGHIDGCHVAEMEKHGHHVHVISGRIQLEHPGTRLKHDQPDTDDIPPQQPFPYDKQGKIKKYVSTQAKQYIRQ